MNKFTIISDGEYLDRNIEGYYHDDYHGGGNYKIDGTIERSSPKPAVNSLFVSMRDFI